MQGQVISALIELTVLVCGVEAWLWGMIRKVNRKRTSWLVGNKSSRMPFLLGLGSQSSCFTLYCRYLLNLPSSMSWKKPKYLVFPHYTSQGKLISFHLTHVLFLTSLFIPIASQLLSQIWALTSWFIPSEPLGPNL